MAEYEDKIVNNLRNTQILNEKDIEKKEIKELLNLTNRESKEILAFV